MREELEAATQWLASHFVDDAQIHNAFKNQLHEVLRQHMENHWYADEPDRAKGMRCLHYAPPSFIDPLLLRAAEEAGVRDAVLFRGVETPQGEFYIWINPGEVKVQMGRDTKYVLSDGNENPYGALRINIEKTIVNVRLDAVPYEPPPQQPLEASGHEGSANSLANGGDDSYSLGSTSYGSLQQLHGRDGTMTPPSNDHSLHQSPSQTSACAAYPPSMGGAMGTSMPGGYWQSTGVFS